MGAETVSTKVTCTFFFGDEAYVRVVKDIFTRKDESNFKEEKQLMQTSFSYTAPVCVHFICERRNRSTWYLTSFSVVLGQCLYSTFGVELEKEFFLA